MGRGSQDCEYCRGGECQARIVVSVAKNITDEHIGIDIIKSGCWQVEDDERRLHDFFQDFPLVAVDVMLIPPETEHEIPGFRWESVDEWQSESHEEGYPGLEEWSDSIHNLNMERMVKTWITEDNL